MGRLSSRVSQNGHYPATLIRSASERLVLGALLLFDPADCPAWEVLDVSDFALTDHQILYRRMQALKRRGAPLEYRSLWEELQGHAPEQHITLTQLIGLTEGIPQFSAEQWKYHIHVLREATSRRRLAMMAMDLARATEDGARIEALTVEFRDRLEGFATGNPMDSGRLENLPSVWRAEVKMEFLIDALLLSGAVTMLCGESGDGKSTFALALAGAVATGSPFLGRTVSQRPVLYLDRENPLFVVKDRLLALEIPETPLLKIWGNWWQEPPGADDPEIVAFVREHKALVVIDSLIAFSRCDENSSQEMRRHMEVYKRLAYLGGSVLVIHHRSDKGEADYRGSSDIKAAFDAAWMLSRTDGSDSADRLDQLELKEFKTRGMVGHRVRLQFGENGFVPLDKPPKPATEIVLDMVGAYPASTQKELRKLGPKYGIGDHAVRNALDSLALTGKLEARVGAHNTRRYHLREVYSAAEA